MFGVFTIALVAVMTLISERILKLITKKRYKSKHLIKSLTVGIVLGPLIACVVGVMVSDKVWKLSHKNKALIAWEDLNVNRGTIYVVVECEDDYKLLKILSKDLARIQCPLPVIILHIFHPKLKKKHSNWGILPPFYKKLYAKYVLFLPKSMKKNNRI